ncbi:hypothetical protein ERJ75_001823600 [Trypanosoma vivax]|nr:hypothetical protein TRVL_00685 [Trypanosoma vivax]KAH8603369.1 hypothetical protein ERJ75_001823600 [Trypanosoma vivax]
MEVDTAYANLFGNYPEAAVLACDELGIQPSDLLFRNRKSFKQSDNDTKDSILIRYTLTERARQHKIRQLLAVKNRILARGDVKEKWKERCSLLPNAPGVPRISKSLMAKLMAKLDTESDSDCDGVDERGSLKPVPAFGLADTPPPPSPIPPAGTYALRSCLSAPRGEDRLARKEYSVHVETEKIDTCETDREVGQSAKAHVQVSDEPSIFEKATMCVSALASVCSVTIARQEAMRKAREREMLRKKTLKGHIIKRYSEDDIVELPDGKFMRTGTNPVPLQPPVPPFLPPVPRPSRSTVALQKDSKDLDSYRHFISRYALESSDMANAYRDFVEKLKKQEPVDKACASGPGSPDTTELTSGLNISSAAARTGSPLGRKVPNRAIPEKTPRERRMEAYVRLAKMEVKRSASNFKKWNDILEDMEDVEPCGTIAADLRAKERIVKCPTFEDYMEGVRERTRRREVSARREQKSIRQLIAAVEKKDRKTAKVLSRRRRSRYDNYVESRHVHREIMLHNKKREERRLEIKQQLSMQRLSRKETRALEYRRTHCTFTSEKRYEHDQESVYRNMLKERVNEMDIKKKWNIKALSL